MCHYAHGEDELREETEADREMAIQGKIKKNPFYKTIMCKSITDCQYGENCVYAHCEEELRSLGNVSFHYSLKLTFSRFAPKCSAKNILNH